MKQIFSALLILLLLPTSLEASLYDLERSPYATLMASKAGDLLTVIVMEKTETEDSGENSRSKKHQMDFSLSKFFFPNFKMNKGFDDTALSGDNPGMEWNSNEKFNSDQTRESSHLVETKFQVRIIEEVLPGQFVIRGKRTVKIEGTDKQIYLSGVIRQEDISKENTIASHLIADALIEIDGQALSKELKPSYLGSLLRNIFF